MEGNPVLKGTLGTMPVPYPAEIRERAVRLALEARKDLATRDGAITRIAKQLDLLPETLRKWVRKAEVDEGLRPGTTTEESERVEELEREVRELRRANQILKSASAFFAAELDRPSR
ncbi:transposase [Gulosibacter sp. 10]|uniref:transposase n=1 Tax=Gulosibacter sp. 10 TaxID=1255570 RepID=UPI000B34EDA8|nr:transposase [Gulosibacter sp. 10]